MKFAKRIAKRKHTFFFFLFFLSTEKLTKVSEVIFFLRNHITESFTLHELLCQSFFVIQNALTLA